MMVEEDALEIIEEIMACGILHSNPQGIEQKWPPQHTAPDLGDDGWNTDTDMAGLLSAIENCGILDAGNNTLQNNKRPRGRPKKKVIKSTGNRKFVWFTPIYVYSGTLSR
jgi:hypothetical protein